MKLEKELRMFGLHKEVSWINILNEDRNTVAEIKGLHHGIPNKECLETAKLFVQVYKMKALVEELGDLSTLPSLFNPRINKLSKKANDILKEL